MMPDGLPQYTPPPARSGSTTYAKGSRGYAQAPTGVAYGYASAGGSYTLSRNGQPWITITQRSGNIDLSDPSGTHKTIITVYPKR